MKREGQTPLSDLDPNVLDTKRRKDGRNEGKQIRRSSSNEEMVMVGGEAIVARQHRQAS